MAKLLPDRMQIPPSKPLARAHVDAWTEEELRSWLSSAGLAKWARDWIESLGVQFGDALPELLGRGLGDSREMPRWMKEGSPDAAWLRQFLQSSDLSSVWFKEQFLQEDPEWLAQLLRYEEAKIARSFLLSGNIADYAFDPVFGYRPTIRLLVDALMRTKDCVLTYRLSQGLTAFGRDPSFAELLPPQIRGRLGAETWESGTPLLTQVCQLFDVLRRWLTGSAVAATQEPDSRAFRRGVAIVFENVHLLIPPHNDNLERNFLVDNLLHWSNSPELFRSSHCLILTAESLEDVSNDLRARGGKIEQITIPRPESVPSRLKFLLPILDPQARMVETRVSRYIGLERYPGKTTLDRLRQLSHDTAGLTLVGIEDLLQEVAVHPSPQLTQDLVLQLKRERLRQESDGLLDVLQPRSQLDDIGGYAPVKERLREVISALKCAGDQLLRSTIPMGMLFLGPPGTGKSITAEAIARESGISMARLGDFRGMYVGQSERNLSRIFSLIESLHPVIVFIDEIDQALGKRRADSGDGGVDTRLFGRFLEFMSKPDHRGRILWIGATNRPDAIDPAMKRAGRFDLFLPFLLPDLISRSAIFRVLIDGEIGAIRNINNRLGEADYVSLAEQTEGFSGAEIRAVVGEVLRRLAREHSAPRESLQLTKELFVKVLADYQPPPEQRTQYRQMEAMAINEVSFLDLLPEEYRQLRRRCAGSPTPRDCQ